MLIITISHPCCFSALEIKNQFKYIFKFIIIINIHYHITKSAWLVKFDQYGAKKNVISENRHKHKFELRMIVSYEQKSCWCKNFTFPWFFFIYYINDLPHKPLYYKKVAYEISRSGTETLWFGLTCPGYRRYYYKKIE